MHHVINAFHCPQQWAFFIFFLVAFFTCLFILSLSTVLGGKSQSRHKHTPFESGIDPVDSVFHLNMFIKFYLIAIYFVLFDVEALYLYLWSISIIESGWIGFIEVMFFVFFLLSGLVYLIRLNSLNWKSEYF
ncbi:MAG: NADH-quinone oxidoreductase subunit A [Buchnera aphidicola (Meitanaphis microgallis)]